MKADVPLEISHSQLMEAVLSNMTEGVRITSFHGEVLYVNQAECDLFGCSPSDLVGSHVSSLYQGTPEERNETFQRIHQELGTRNYWEGSISLERRDGRSFRSRARISKFELNGSHYWLCVHRLIEEEETLKEQLEQIRDFFEATLKHMPAIFYAKDLSGKYIHINPGFEELFGLTNSQVIHFTDYDLFPKYLADQFRKNDTRIARQKKAELCEERVVTREGKEEWYHSYKYPYVNSAGEVYATGGISINISMLKQAKEQMEASRLMVEKSAKLAALGEMAGGIAHEINNPLTVIYGYAQLIIRHHELGMLDVENAASCSDKIIYSVKRMQRIVKGLKTFAKEEAGEPFDVCSAQQVAKEVVDLCRARFVSDGIDFQYFAPQENINMTCRGYQIGQVLLNLLNNAHHASLHSKERKVIFEVQEKGRMVQFLVSDSGGGISLENREKLFNPFFTTKPVGEGTGLGLSISKTIAKNHRGDLYLDENTATTTFVLEIPGAPSNEESKANPSAESAVPYKSQKFY